MKADSDIWLRQYFVDRLGALDRERAGWLGTWRELAGQFAPRRGRFPGTPGDPRRGSRGDENILDNTPLLAATEDALRRQQITLHLVPDRSTLSATPNWPILFWNLLTWRARETPGLTESNFRLGSEVAVRALTNSVQLTMPGGATRTLTKSAEEFVLEPDVPGLYTVSTGASAWQFAVNLLAPEESDLSTAKTGKWGEWEKPEETRREYASVLWLFVLGALVVLVAHLFLVTHSKARV